MATQTKDLMIFHPILVLSYLLTAIGGGAWLHDLGYLLPALTVAGLVVSAVVALMVVRVAFNARTIGGLLLAAVFAPLGVALLYGIATIALEGVRHGF